MITPERLKECARLFLEAAEGRSSLLQNSPAKTVRFPDVSGREIKFVHIPSRFRRIIQSLSRLVFRRHEPTVWVPIEQFADYETVLDENYEASANSLGNKCGSLYNALVRNAVNKFWAKNTLVTEFSPRFYAVGPPSTSVADIGASTNGWVSFQLRFACAKLPK